MAITFVSWDSCDWNGGYDLQWATDDSVRLRLMTPYIDAVRQALFERLGVIPGAMISTATNFADISDAATLSGESALGRLYWVQPALWMAQNANITGTIRVWSDGATWYITNTRLFNAGNGPADTFWYNATGPYGVYSPGGIAVGNRTITRTVYQTISDLWEMRIGFSASYLVKAIDKVIDNLVPVTLASPFVNHLDNSGDWTGTPLGVPPRWTRASMLTALGDSSWISLSLRNGIIPLATWIRQKKRVVDLLRWTIGESTGFVADNTYLYASTIRQERVGQAVFNTDWATTWSDLAADWAIQPWGISYVVGLIESRNRGRKSDITASVRLEKRRSLNAISNFYLNHYLRDIDWYLYINHTQSGPYTSKTFDDQGIGLVEDANNRYLQDTGLSGLYNTASAYAWESYTELSTPEPVDPAPGDYEDASWNAETGVHFAVVKWDSTGGFLFV